MIDVNQVRNEAEKEIREEVTKKAKEEIKALLRKKEQAKNVLANIERELADAYAELGRGSSEPTA
jgi:seryl-tRNA synthetase